MKFSGKVGFWVGDKETEPGIWIPMFIQRPYVGDVIRNIRKNQDASDKINKDLSINNRISILSDLYAQNNWHNVRYVLWNGARWEVSSVELAYPRIYLDLGGQWHGTEDKSVTS